MFSLSKYRGIPEYSDMSVSSASRSRSRAIRLQTLSKSAKFSRVLRRVKGRHKHAPLSKSNVTECKRKTSAHCKLTTGFRKHSNMCTNSLTTSTPGTASAAATSFGAVAGSHCQHSFNGEIPRTKMHQSSTQRSTRLCCLRRTSSAHALPGSYRQGM